MSHSDAHAHAARSARLTRPRKKEKKKSGRAPHGAGAGRPSARVARQRSLCTSGNGRGPNGPPRAPLLDDCGGDARARLTAGTAAMDRAPPSRPRVGGAPPTTRQPPLFAARRGHGKHTEAGQALGGPPRAPNHALHEAHTPPESNYDELFTGERCASLNSVRRCGGVAFARLGCRVACDEASARPPGPRDWRGVALLLARRLLPPSLALGAPPPWWGSRCLPQAAPSPSRTRPAAVARILLRGSWRRCWAVGAVLTAPRVLAVSPAGRAAVVSVPCGPPLAFFPIFFFPLVRLRSRAPQPVVVRPQAVAKRSCSHG